MESKLEIPKLSDRFKVYFEKDHILVDDRENGEFLIIKSSIAACLLESIDGKLSTRDLIELLSRQYDVVAELYFTLFQLVDKELVVEAAGDFSKLGLQSGAILQPQVALILQSEGFALNIIKQHFIERGLDVQESAAFSVVFTSGYLNEVPDDAGLDNSEFPVRHIGNQLWIGPVLGDGGVCGSCFINRVRMNQPAQAFRERQNGVKYDASNKEIPLTVQHLIGSITAQEVSKFLRLS